MLSVAGLKEKGAICLKRIVTLTIIVTLFTFFVRARTDDDDLQKRVDALQLKTSLQTQEIRHLRQQNQKLKSELRKYKLREMVKKLEKEVPRIRRLPLKKPLQTHFMSTDELRKLLINEMNRQYPGDTLQSYQEVLTLLGFIPPGTDIRKTLMALYGEQVAGLYDDRTKTLYIRSDFYLNDTIANIILSHEMCHALQDQHFNLESLNIHRTDNDDIVLAGLCIAEGDATFLMSEWFGEYLNITSVFQLLSTIGIDQSAYNQAPYFIQQTLIFPYIQGVLFLTNIMGKYGLEGRDIPFRHPPQSTEQVLHPEKYLDVPDTPTSVTLASYLGRLGKGWKKKYTNVFGELGFKLLFEQYLDIPEAGRAAAGWDGDRYDLYKDTAGHFLLVWDSVWDTQRDAREARDALRRVLITHYPMLKVSGENGAWQLEGTPETSSAETYFIRLEEKNSRLHLLFTDERSVSGIAHP